MFVERWSVMTTQGYVPDWFLTQSSDLTEFLLVDWQQLPANELVQLTTPIRTERSRFYTSVSKKIIQTRWNVLISEFQRC